MGAHQADTDSEGLLAAWSLQQALFREARLLDEERLSEWMEMLTDDVVYRMRLTSRRFRKDRAAPLAVGHGYIVDDNRERLSLRIKRLQSGYVWAEDPPNHVRRLLSNVEIMAGESTDEKQVHSVLLLHRSRIDNQGRRLIAGRTDRWRNVEGRWLLAIRDISLDHSTVPDTNLNVFF